ncbi:hypothetical protein Pelo_18196 [Pelomyxa schiedti]|nr:hypothetical protein Pelo_18196 [Pelomyxa schiedti]
MMVNRQGNDRETTKLSIPGYCNLEALYIADLCFDKVAQNEITAVLTDQAKRTAVFLVVDLEHSHSAGCLSLFSATTSLVPVNDSFWKVTSTLVMRRNGGRRAFILVIRMPPIFGVYEVEEGTALVRQLAESERELSVSQLDESRFCVYYVHQCNVYYIWEADRPPNVQVEAGLIFLVGENDVKAFEVTSGQPVFNIEAVSLPRNLGFPLKIHQL